MLASILAYIVLAVTVFCVTPTFAQLPPSTYEVHDVLSGQKTKESWYTQGNRNVPGVFITQKVVQITTLVASTETSIATPSWWTRKTQERHKNVYYEEFLADAPFSLSPGESTFGYVYVKDITTDNVTESWPLFVAVSDDQGAKKIIFTMYLPENKIMEVVRVYVGANYFFPIYHQVKMYKSGVNPATLSDVVNPSAVLDTYLVAKRLR